MKRDVVGVGHPIIKRKIDASLNLSVKEGAFAAVSTNLSLSYFAPFALALNATAVQMGALYALISLLPGLAQMKAADLIGRFPRKKIVFNAVLLKIFLLIPILSIAFLHWRGVPYMIEVFILLVGVHYVLTAIAHPAWFSWMGSLVPENRRGKYFARRNRIVGFFGVVAMIGGALILDGFKKYGTLHGDVIGFTLLGFGAVFALSGISRFWCLGLLNKEYEPRLKIRKKDRFSFMHFLKNAKKTPFGRFSLFGGALAFVVGISTPYWAVYMLRDMGMSYIWYMSITVATIFFQLIFFPLLGKFSDRFGNIKLMSMSSSIIAVVPFLWIASALIMNDLWAKIYLLTLPSMIGGFAWAGYNLALNNYVYDAVGSRRRGFSLSYMNLLIGFGGFVGAGVGALLAWADIGLMGNSMLFIFAVSGVGRLIVAFYGSKYLSEVRNVKKFAPQFLIREFDPLQGAIREVHHLEHLVKKVEHYVEVGDKKRFSGK